MKRDDPQATNYSQIPDPQYWYGDWPDRWTIIAESICPRCDQPIGYQRLCNEVAYNVWQHSDRKCIEDAE